MTAYIALLRGINLLGKTSLRMTDLKAIADELGLESARTFIASGNLLFISGERREGETGTDQREFLHLGIGARSFERRFQIADYVKVKSATFADGLLTIDLVREVPEAMRPRRVEIARGAAPTNVQIEGERAA